jgi:hypothetical protein
MKNLSTLLLLFCIACNSRKTISLEKQIDSLKQERNNTYKPGLGEFMSAIQMHHAKLWFAGVNGNWQLADFEINEIKEIIDDIQKFCPERPETKSLKDFLLPGIDSVYHAIGKQDIEIFKDKFAYLTTSCNNCHRANGFGINVVTIPTSPPVSNQDFRPVIKKDSLRPVVQERADSARRQ